MAIGPNGEWIPDDTLWTTPPTIDTSAAIPDLYENPATGDWYQVPNLQASPAPEVTAPEVTAPGGGETPAPGNAEPTDDIYNQLPGTKPSAMESPFGLGTMITSAGDAATLIYKSITDTVASAVKSMTSEKGGLSGWGQVVAQLGLGYLAGTANEKLGEKKIAADTATQERTIQANKDTAAELARTQAEAAKLKWQQGLVKPNIGLTANGAPTIVTPKTTNAGMLKWNTVNPVRSQGGRVG